MSRVDLIVESPASMSARAQQLSAMFDVPPTEKCRKEWHGEVPIDAHDWNVGLIVGPSGSGKSSVARALFAGDYHPNINWSGRGVVDDFADNFSMKQVTEVCSVVGFNTIPAWLRPFAVLSNGERFRVELARRMLELPDPIVVDEFSSVVDRQVAQIGAHGVQKYARKNKRRFVAISCHYDIIDWLQPDWIFEPATMAFARRSLQRRPMLNVTIGRVPYAAWRLFAPFHYMSADLHRAARCFGLWVEKTLTTFCAVLSKPVSRGEKAGEDIKGISRIVTLPDWQGLGLAFALTEKLGAAYAAIGKRFRNYPAHPAFIRAHMRCASWVLKKPAGRFSPISTNRRGLGSWGGRPCAIFEFCGAAMPQSEAKTLLSVA